MVFTILLFLVVGTVVIGMGLSQRKRDQTELTENILDYEGTDKTNNDLRNGLLLLGGDMVLIIFFVALFGLNFNSYWWENIFAVISILLIPCTAVFLIIRHFIKK